MRRAIYLIALFIVSFFICGCEMVLFVDEKVDETFNKIDNVKIDIDISHISDQKVDLKSSVKDNNETVALLSSELDSKWSFKQSIVEKIEKMNLALETAKKEIYKLNQWYCTENVNDSCYKLSNINNVITLYYYQYFTEQYVSYNKMIFIPNEDGTYTINNYFNVGTLSNYFHNYKEYISFTDEKNYEYIHYMNDADILTAYHSSNNNGYWETVEVSQKDTDSYDVTTHIKGLQGYYYTYWSVNKDESDYTEFEAKNIPNKKSILNIYPINLDTNGHIASKVIFLEFNRDILDGILAFLSTGFESYWNNNPERESAYATYNIATKSGVMKHGYANDVCAFAGAYTDKTKIMFECKQKGLALSINSIKSLIGEFGIELKYVMDGDEIEAMVSRVPLLANTSTIYNTQNLTDINNIDELKQKANTDLLILTDFIDMPR